MSQENVYHYNRFRRESRYEREEDKLIGTRKLHNWIKAFLMRAFCPEHSNILDVCCGKGGDVPKLSFRSPANYVGIDHSAASIEEARKRSKMIRFSVHFYEADVHQASVLSILKKYPPFHYVQCHFALHYAFESEERFHTFCQMIGEVTKGTFVITVADEKVLQDRWNIKGSQFGNSLYQIKREHETDTTSIYGKRYLFSIGNLIESCPEYVVSKKHLLHSLAKQGLQCIMEASFTDIWREENERCPLVYLMDADGRKTKRRLNEEEWEIVQLYRVYVFSNDHEKRKIQTNKYQPSISLPPYMKS